MDEKLKFEEALTELEEIVAEMESEDACLEEMVKKCERGYSLLKFCTNKLDEVEKRFSELKPQPKEDELGF